MSSPSIYPTEAVCQVPGIARARSSVISSSVFDARKIDVGPSAPPIIITSSSVFDPHPQFLQIKLLTLSTILSSYSFSKPFPLPGLLDQLLSFLKCSREIVCLPLLALFFFTLDLSPGCMEFFFSSKLHVSKHMWMPSDHLI